jgi:hypothetical protein
VAATFVTAYGIQAKQTTFIIFVVEKWRPIPLVGLDPMMSNRSPMLRNGPRMEGFVKNSSFIL